MCESPQVTCTWCNALCGEGKPWYALMSICSGPSKSDFSWQLCEQCYRQIQRALIGVMQQNLRTEIAVVKQQAAGLKI